MSRSFVPRIVVHGAVCVVATFASVAIAKDAAVAAAPFDATQTGRVLTRQFTSGALDSLQGVFNAQMSGLMSPQQLKTFYEQVRDQFGTETKFLSEETTARDGKTVYTRIAKYDKTDKDIRVVWTFDAQGKVAGVNMQPVQDAAPTRFMEYESKTVLRLPLDGDWQVLWGGRAVRDNAHAVTFDQRFAVDFVMGKDGATHRGDGKRNADYYSWGAPVVAPGAGTVVAVLDGVADNVPGVMDEEKPLGNHVIIDHGNSEYSFLCHLQNGSVAVKPGQAVAAGDALGLCGNSGVRTNARALSHAEQTGTVPRRGLAGAVQQLPRRRRHGGARRAQARPGRRRRRRGQGDGCQEEAGGQSPAAVRSRPARRDELRSQRGSERRRDLRPAAYAGRSRRRLGAGAIRGHDLVRRPAPSMVRVPSSPPANRSISTTVRPGARTKPGIAMLPESASVRAWNSEAAALAREIRTQRHTDHGAPPGELARVNALCEELNAALQSQVTALLERGKLVGTIGGDHGAVYGAIAAHAAHFPGLGVLHVDAHADLRPEYEGFTYSHASIMNNVVRRLPDVARLVQVGIRDFCEDELELVRASEGRVQTWFDADLARERFEGATWQQQTAQVLAGLPENVYVSFDVDGLDPALCPHTGTPVPGGMSFPGKRRICWAPSPGRAGASSASTWSRSRHHPMATNGTPTSARACSTR